MMDLAVLIRAWYLRALGYTPSLTSLGLDLPGGVAAQNGLASDPVEVWGRNSHAVQVSGLLTNGGGVQIQSSLDGINFLDLGSQINANGISQLATDALYGYLRAVMKAGGGSTTLAADAHAHDTEVQVAAVAALPTSGYVILDAAGANMLIHYTGVDSGTPKKLTGIPANGFGSITGTVVSTKTVTSPIGDTTTVRIYSAIV